MNIKILITALAMAVATMGVSPSDASAKPKNHYKKAIKKAHKQNRKFYKKSARHYYKHDGWNDRRRVKIKYDYDRPDYDSEDWGIYSTPTGGLGFYYSESEGPRYGYPYGYDGYGYNYGYPYGWW